MKRFLTVLLVLLGLAVPAVADEKFSDFITNAPTPSTPYNATDYLPLVRAGTTYHVPGNILNTIQTSAAQGRMVGFPSLTWTSDNTLTTAWTYISPLASAFTCTTTTSQCFQEALDYATINGLSVDLFCSGERSNGTQYPFISTTTAIDIGRVPATYTYGGMAQRGLWGHGCNITFSTAVNSGVAFKANTMLDGAWLFWDGQIQCNTMAPAASFACFGGVPSVQPSGETTNGVGIFNSFIRVGAVSVGTGAVSATVQGSVALFDVTSGSISASDIRFGELNASAVGGGAIVENGLKTTGAQPTTGFFFNHVQVGDLHQAETGVLNGSGTNQSNYGGNTWRVMWVLPNNPDGTTGACFSQFGSDLQIIMGCTNNEGPFKNGLVFQAGSGGNNAIVTVSGNTGVAVVDTAANNSWCLTGTCVTNNGRFFNAGMQSGPVEFHAQPPPAPSANCTNGGTATAVLNSAGDSSNDNRFTVKFGNGSATACTLTFVTTFTSNAICLLQTPNGGQQIKITNTSPTAITFAPYKTSDGTATTFANNQLVFGHCM